MTALLIRLRSMKLRKLQFEFASDDDRGGLDNIGSHPYRYFAMPLLFNVPWHSVPSHPGFRACSNLLAASRDRDGLKTSKRGEQDQAATYRPRLNIPDIYSLTIRPQNR
ncbi:MAG: hypothetical protein M3O30_12985 [Planctomycetota bacterium]|nr:hypothetical protein [Planctomycetota bacterium]